MIYTLQTPMLTRDGGHLGFLFNINVTLVIFVVSKNKT
jgi:hypothetical protein